MHNLIRNELFTAILVAVILTIAAATVAVRLVNRRAGAANAVGAGWPSRLYPHS